MKSINPSFNRRVLIKYTKIDRSPMTSLKVKMSDVDRRIFRVQEQ
jgi:hypothetical protein